MHVRVIFLLGALPAPAQGNPITYRDKNGKQYVVIDAADSGVAFSLP